MKHVEFGNGDNGLYFAQDNPNAEDGQDYVFFTKDQIPTLIEWLCSEIGIDFKNHDPNERTVICSLNGMQYTLCLYGDREVSELKETLNSVGIDAEIIE